MSDGPSFTTMPASNDTSAQWSTDTETDEARGVSPFLYFLLLWGVLVLSIGVLIGIVCIKPNRHRQQNDDNTTMEEGRTGESNNDPKTTTNNHFGVVAALTATNAIVAFALSVYAITTCEFLDASGRPISITFLPLEVNQDPYTIEIYSLGLWSLVANSNAPGYLVGDLNGKAEACFELSDLFYLDGYYKLARASAVISSLVGGLALLAVMVFAFDSVRLRRFSRVLAWSFGVAAVFQLLTLSFFGTGYCDSTNCQLDLGGVVSVTAAPYWMFCLFAVLAV